MRALKQAAEHTSPIRQVHVRVPAALKRAVKMLCVREGTTEQAWIYGLIEDRLKRQAPDLWPGGKAKLQQNRELKAR
jgi:predicted DNA binding CopG/RHH family protein